MAKFFALLFTISISIFLFYWIVPKEKTAIQEKSNPYIQQKTGIPFVNIDFEALNNNDRIIMYGAIGSSLLSLFGFVLSLRGNRREKKLMDLKLEREGLELEKLRTELEQLKNT